MDPQVSDLKRVRGIRGAEVVLMRAAGVERRSFERFAIPVPVRFRISQRKDEWKSRIVDLSEGGAAFFCPYWVREGSLISLSFPIGSERFTLQGVVAQCLESETVFRIGLYFLRPTRGFRIKLSEEVDEIRRLRRELHASRGKDVSLEEAARERVEASAEKHPELYVP